MNVYVDTCVLPRCRMETAKIYRERFGSRLGFEFLPMFDMAEFEANLKENLDVFMECPLDFHEPVFCVEHTAKKGTSEYEESMYHINLTKKYADILKPKSMVYHVNNGVVIPEKKDEMLATSLENLEEMRDIFPDVDILVENVGTAVQQNILLDQAEFTDLCRDKKFGVVIDIGHANANSWDIYKLVDDLASQVKIFHLHNNDGQNDQHRRILDGTIDFPDLFGHILNKAPNADFVIEYVRPEYHGEQLMEDIETVFKLMEK